MAAAYDKHTSLQGYSLRCGQASKQRRTIFDIQLQQVTQSIPFPKFSDSVCLWNTQLVSCSLEVRLNSFIFGRQYFNGEVLQSNSFCFVMLLLSSHFRTVCGSSLDICRPLTYDDIDRTSKLSFVQQQQQQRKYTDRLRKQRTASQQDHENE